jgi:hypothetical protein
LLEFGGELVPVPTWREEEYAQAKEPDCLARASVSAQSTERTQEVASVQCLGVDLVSGHFAFLGNKSGMRNGLARWE